MDILSKKVDSAKIEAGAWVDDIPGMGDLRLNVRGYNSMIATQCRAEKMRSIPLSERAEDGSITSQQSRTIFAEAHVEAVVLGWENLTENGEDVPYSEEAARKYCLDPDFSAFNDAITYAAGVIDRSKSEEAKALGKS